MRGRAPDCLRGSHSCVPGSNSANLAWVFQRHVLVCSFSMWLGDHVNGGLVDLILKHYFEPSWNCEGAARYFTVSGGLEIMSFLRSCTGKKWARKVTPNLPFRRTGQFKGRRVGYNVISRKYSFNSRMADVPQLPGPVEWRALKV